MKDEMEFKWYDLGRTLSRFSDADLIFVVGPRSDGKTYSFKQWAIKSWLATGAEFVYIRRLRDEVDSVKHTLFDDIASTFGVEVKLKGDRFKIRIEGAETWEDFGFIIPLSEQQNFKSASFPNVDKIAFDEFIIESGRRRYLPREYEQFINLIFTIARDRKVRVVCFSNAAAIANPYFSEYGITTNDFNNGVETASRNGGSVVFNVYEANAGNRERRQQGLIGRISSSAYQDYALGNEFVDVVDENIVDTSTMSTPLFAVVVSDKDCFVVGAMKNGAYLVRRGSNAGVPQYQMVRGGSEIFDPDLISKLKRAQDRKRLFYTSPSDRAIFIGSLY